jgi:hypothetical protein
MSRAAMAATLLACLTFTAGCSGSKPEIVATNQPTAGAASTSAEPGPTENPSPLDGLSAVEVWQKTKTDTAEAATVHVAARFAEGKERIAINLKMAESGKAFGVLVFNGNKITVRRLGRTLYFKADRGFWTTNADAATARVLSDKWIMVRKGFSKEMEQFFELTDMNFILDDALSLTAAEQRSLKLVPGIDIGTQSTVGLADETSTQDGELRTLYVSDTDPALPLNFTGSDSSQYMKFRGWGENFTVVAPKGAIDLAKAS